MSEKIAAKSQKLAEWQERLAMSDQEYSGEVALMNEREAIYNGDRKLKNMVRGDKAESPGEAVHVRNIVFENIESQVSTTIPKPKVTPRRKEDEHLAETIEHFLRNELDRLPFETMNDMAERTVPLQGGVGFWVDWDNTKRSFASVGECSVSLVHPKQYAPQPGVYTDIEDMDWYILKVPTTKEAVRRRYGVTLESERESEPEIRTAEGTTMSEDALTMYVGFERNDNGGINRYCWVNDSELEDLENYQARRQPVCKQCGKMRPLPGQEIVDVKLNAPGNLMPDPERGFAGGMIPAGLFAQVSMEQPADNLAGAGPEKYEGGACPYCGCEDWTSKEQEFEEIMLPVKTAAGNTVPGAVAEVDGEGNMAMKPTKVPFYRPDVYPIVLQRSVSVYGKLLGNSDVDVIRDQQNTINRLEQKIISRLMNAGTRVSLPNNASLKMSPVDGEIWRLKNPSDKAMIGVYEFKGDLQYELMYLANVYEEARQILGITDSFQGREDSTATSGKAKEFSAAQAAGRLESKRVMKNAAYAKLFELMFKFALAYVDEPRPVSYKDSRGETVYEEFNRYDFLEQGADGRWYWNDQFLFSCDASASLASNREAMWQETRMNLQQGAFGDPGSTETLILFWSKMEELHYPGAGSTKKYLEERLEREQQARSQMQPGGITPQMLRMIQEQARQDAAAAAGAQ